MLVILESPYAGEVERNKTYAVRCMKDSLHRGESPLLSHLLYTQCLDDTVPEERKMGMSAGWDWIKQSGKTAVYEDYGISSGMEQGIKIAKELGHEIEYRRIGKNP